MANSDFPPPSPIPSNSSFFGSGSSLSASEKPRRRIALIAHDNKKPIMVEWARRNKAILERHELCATGTTGGLLTQEVGLDVLRFKSGPLGGDQQIGGLIVDGKVDLLVFFWDPLSPHPHDVDVRALLRIAVVYDVPVACNLSSADLVISSPLL